MHTAHDDHICKLHIN